MHNVSYWSTHTGIRCGEWMCPDFGDPGSRCILTWSVNRDTLASWRKIGIMLESTNPIISLNCPRCHTCFLDSRLMVTHSRSLCDWDWCVWCHPYCPSCDLSIFITSHSAKGNSAYYHLSLFVFNLSYHPPTVLSLPIFCVLRLEQY